MFIFSYKVLPMSGRQPDLQKLQEIEAFFTRHHSTIKQDGIIDLQSFCQAPLKILWILREFNEVSHARQCGGDIRYDLRTFAQTQYGNVAEIWEGYSHTYRLIAKISWSLLNGGQLPSKPARVLAQEVLDKIAVVNPKKWAGGANINPAEINRFYQQNKDLLHLQIEAINPDLIFNASKNQDLLMSLSPQEPFVRAGAFSAAWQQNSRRAIVNVYHPDQRTINHRTYLQWVEQCLKDLQFYQESDEPKPNDNTSS